VGDPREPYGRLVRDTWVAAVEELVKTPKPSWVTPWDDLDDPFQREVDMRMGAAVAATERERIAAQIQAEAAGHLFTIRRGMRWAAWVALGKPADRDPGDDHARERQVLETGGPGFPCCPVETAAVARAVAAERERITSELKAHMAAFFGHYGNNTALSLQRARDLAEGIRQILDREPL
jgi:hypothetical protein